MQKDRRTQRTRRALMEGLNRLILNGRQGHIRVADVVAEARVGRSTFYDHYSGAEELHLEALRQPFAVVADAAAGNGDVAAVERLLVHFWQHRQRGRTSLIGRGGEARLRLLADMVEERIRHLSVSLPPRLAARQLAGAAFAAIVAWISGEASCAPDALARSICAAGRAARAALTACDQETAFEPAIVQRTTG